MNVFFCALRTDGASITKRELFTFLARLPKNVEWDSCTDGSFAGVAMSRKHSLRPLTGKFRSMVGVGDVRLDDRAEITAMIGDARPCASDLELVLALIDRHGPESITALSGDFAFVAWDARARKIVAARDPFGVKPLFYRRTADHLLLCSRLEPLAGDGKFEEQYIANFLSGFAEPALLTIWKDTLQVQAGGMLIQRGSVTAQGSYWDARNFEPEPAISQESAVEEFRDLFFTSLRQRVSPGETWSQLSGGLDSSAVVSGTEWLREKQLGTGLCGTVTLTDSLGNGDERRFSDLVVARYGVRNELLRDYWPWRSDLDGSPSASDEPSPLFPFYARDEHMVDLITRNGGRILLSGLGSDHYMYGSLSYMADLAVRGHFRTTAQEVLGWALASRRSFWTTARRTVVDPIAKNLRTRNRIRLGKFYVAETALELRRVSSWVQRGPFQDRIEMRYPFLSRKLVEFTLRLPVQMKVRPTARKWILREAMRGVLPEEVRLRSRKGGMDARVLWTLEHERPLIDALLAKPILGDFNFVNVDELRTTVDLARNGAWQNTVQVLSVLALESWLRARNDVWPVMQKARQSAA